MSKLTLQTLTTITGGEPAAIALLNQNFDDIVSQIDLLISRDAESPNAWTANQDANSVKIINLADGVNDQDAATVGQVNASSETNVIITQDEGVQVDSAATTLNFVGSGVTATGGSGTTTITIAAGAAPIDTVFGLTGTVAISTLSAQASPNGATDYVVIEEGGGTFKKTLLNNLPTGAGETNTASNVGTDGVGVFKQKTALDLEFRHVAPASSKVTVVDNSDDIDIDIVEANIDHDSLSGFVGNEHINHANVSMATSSNSGLAGGGTLASTRELVLDVDNLAVVSAVDQAADYIPIYDDSGAVTGKALVSLITGAGWTASHLGPITSGSTVEWTGIPSTATHFRIAYANSSLSGTDELELQLGDASSYTNTAVGGVYSHGGTASWPVDAAQLDLSAAAANVRHGIVEGSVVKNAAGTAHIWAIMGSNGETNNSDPPNTTAGSITLTSALTRIRLATSGSNTFDSGSFTLYYQ